VKKIERAGKVWSEIELGGNTTYDTLGKQNFGFRRDGGCPSIQLYLKG